MEKIRKLKELFKKEKIDGYIVPKNDEFFGEYIPSNKDRLNFISNFTGSFGFSLILKKKNYLFVDGRYTLQANDQSGKFYRVITFPHQMPKNFLKHKNLLIGFDPKLITKKTLNVFFGKNLKYKPIKENLVDKIWKRKVGQKKKKFYKLPNHSVGENHSSKINKIVNILKKRKADFQFITASENNAWLLNIRGRDTEYTPIPNSYLLIEKSKKIKFFCDLKKISASLKRKLKKIQFIDIKNTGKILENINKKKFIIDRNTCSLYFENIILKNNKILDFEDPIYFLKAIKKKKEIKNIIKAHIYDGIALTKYLFWLKKNFTKKKITEISASKNCTNTEEKIAILNLFWTISGSGPNGAVIHYKATKKLIEN